MTRVDGVLVHWDPPAPSDRGPHCGELGEQHVDVWFNNQYAMVEVYLSGYDGPGDTYRRDAWDEDVFPPRGLARLFGDTIDRRIARAIKSRAALLRQQWAEERELRAIRNRGDNE